MTVRFLCFPRTLRFFATAFAGVLALAASTAVVSAQDVNAPATATPAAAAEAGGTRWSTVDLGALFQADPKGAAADVARKPARLKELRATVKPRAVAAGADLVWDLAGQSQIGISPVLFADPSLALPAAAPARVIAVDMARLYDNHPDTLVSNTKIQALDKTYAEEFDRMEAAGHVLLADYKRLTESGNAGAAEKKLKQIEAKKEEMDAFTKKARSHLSAEVRAFRGPMLARLVAAAVESARARGATLVLDTAGPSHLGVSPLVYVDPALQPAPAGGARAEGAPATVEIRTVDLARLYDNHPGTRALPALAKADEKKAKAEHDRLEKATARLLEQYTKLVEKGETAAAEKVLDQITDKASEYEDVKAKASEAGEQRLAAHRKTTVAEIAKVSREAARRAGATLLLDAGGQSHLGISYIMYASPKLDLTEAIAKEMKIALPR